MSELRLVTFVLVLKLLSCQCSVSPYLNFQVDVEDMVRSPVGSLDQLNLYVSRFFSRTESDRLGLRQVVEISLSYSVDSLVVDQNGVIAGTATNNLESFFEHEGQ